VSPFKRERRARDRRRLLAEPRQDEISFKAWRIAEAQKHGVSVDAIYDWKRNGYYPGLKIRKVNKRIMLVKLPSPEMQPRPATAINIRQWASAEMARTGLTRSGLSDRMKAGKYPGLIFGPAIAKRKSWVMEREQ